MTTDILPVISSPEDKRDFLIKATGESLPLVVELDIYEVENQLGFNSCVANAMCSALEIYYKRQGTPRDLSRMYHYWWTRALSKIQGQDSGSYPRDMCKAISRFGICDETTYPYDNSNLFRVPSEQAIIEALPNDNWEYAKIPVPTGYDGVPEYTTCNTLIKEQLAQGRPVLLTIQLDSNFSTSCVGNWRTQEWLKYSRGAPTYGHQMLIVGYDDNPEYKRFKVLNSWGTSFGDSGYCGLLYQPLKGKLWQSGLIKELWVIYPKS